MILPSCRRRVRRARVDFRVCVMDRILVMGSPRSGKSTFARRLSDITGIPVVSLDALFWKPGWAESEMDESRERVTHAARRPLWTRDGNDSSPRAQRHRDAREPAPRL